MEVYKEYLLTIRNSLIQCGVGLPLKDDYTYEELFELSEVIDQILWYYSILAVSNSRNKLKGFIFSLDDTYMSVMRRMLYQEYCETQKDYKGIFAEDLESSKWESEGSNYSEDDYREEGYHVDDQDEDGYQADEEQEEDQEDDYQVDDQDQEAALNAFRSLLLSKKENKSVEDDNQEDDEQEADDQEDAQDQEAALNDFRSLILSKKENKPIEGVKSMSQLDELGDDDFPDWGDSDDEEEDEDDQGSSFEEDDNTPEESEGVTYISKDSMSIDEKGFYVYDGNEEDEDPDPFFNEKEEDEEEEDDVDFPELNEEDDDDVDFPELNEDDEDDLFSEPEDDVDSELEGWDEDSDDGVEEQSNESNEDDMFPDNEDEDDIFGEDSEEEDDEDLFPDWNADDDEDESPDVVNPPDRGNDGSVESSDDEDDLFPSWGDDDINDAFVIPDDTRGNQDGSDKVHKEKVVHKKEYVKDQEDILAETLQGAVSGVINFGKRLGKKGMSRISNNINRKE